MPHSTFQQLTASLIQRATGSPADDGVLDRVQAMLADVGLHDDRQIPAYFFDGIRGILARTLVPWVRLPEHEQGLGWILCRLADVVPGTSSEEVGAYDRFAAPALGHGVVVHRRDDAAGYSEWYAVEALDAAGRPVGAPPPRPAPTILGTFQPTTDQIRCWAYDPDLYFASQDEELAIDDLGFLDLLVELASDPHGPKRARLRDVIHTIGPGRVLGRRNDARAAVAAVAAALRGSPDPELRADAIAAEVIVTYLDGRGPVTGIDARAIARHLLASPGRPSPDLEITEVAGWWQVTARRSETPVIELLYVHRATGALAYRRGSPLARRAGRSAGTDPALPARSEPTMTMHCPRCGSDRVHGSKSTLPQVEYREFGCMNCGLVESHAMDADDYSEWMDRWVEPWQRKPRPAKEP